MALSRLWRDWRSTLVIVQPATVVGWHRQGFRLYSWQNPYVERLIGTIRRECLDHVLVLSEAHLKRILSAYFDYYHRSRPHQSLGGNAPDPREVEPPHLGPVIAIPQVGGLHHRYTRRAA